MNTAVIVPLSELLDDDRQRAWRWVETRYRTSQPEWEIVTGTCTGPWIKANAVADAITKTSADLLIVADSDVWCVQLPEFVARVADGTLEWATPHSRVFRLNRLGADHLLDGTLDLGSHPPKRWLTQSHQAMLGGGLVVVPRALYERCPLDPRFVGWGGEDESFGRALCTFTSRRSARLHGANVLWHLHHAPQQRLNRKVGNEANAALGERYRLAAGDVAATAALIEEGRCHSRLSSPAPSRS